MRYVLLLAEPCATLLYYRLAGSYEALEAGSTADALVDFTGGVSESVNLKDGGYSEDLDKRMDLFKVMLRAMKDNSLCSASVRVRIRVNRCTCIHHHFAKISIRTFNFLHEIYTAVVRTYAKFQTASINESKDRELVWNFIVLKMYIYTRV